MSLNRHAKSRDLNEPGIVQALEKVGCSVARLDRPVDLVVGFRGRTYLLEVKQHGGRLQPSQEDFLRGWVGDIAAVVRNATEALTLIGALEQSVSIGDRIKATTATSPWLTGENQD